MAKEPQFPKRDLNQTAVDAIATRIDSYDQAWERRISTLMDGIERMEQTSDRIAQRVDEIAEFIGTATQEQRATQIRLEKLEEKVDRRFDALTTTLEGFQALSQQQSRNVEKMMELATAVIQGRAV